MRGLGVAVNESGWVAILGFGNGTLFLSSGDS